MPKLNTKQRIFDYVAKKLIEQGRPSISAGTSCRYRAPGGLKCGVGHLIPDKRYKPKLENRTPNQPSIQKVLYKSIPKTKSVYYLLEDLQDAHDNAAFNTATPKEWRRSWKNKMRHVAAEHDLKTKALA